MKARTEHSGFTIIELIVVIVFLGIVGAVIVPRFLSPNAFSERAAQDGVITTIRAAQQSSLGRDAVTFEIDAAGGNWVLTAKASSNIIRTFEIPAAALILETGSAVASANSCANDFDTTVDSDFELVFDGQGNLEEFTNNGTTELVDASFNGVRICLNNTVELSVCVSPAGYAYAGNCDE